MLRKIALKTFAPIVGVEGDVTSAALLETVVASRQKSGETLVSMRAAVKVLDALEAAKASGAAELFLDESSWQFLKGRVESMTWAFAHRVFIEFSDDVLNAVKFDPNSAEG
jgi:hypothetical protein